MKIIMTGIDHSSAPIALREKLSLNNEKVLRLNEAVCGEQGVFGCAVVSTCNRAEIYISCRDDVNIKADRLLTEKLSLDYNDFDGCFYSFENKDAIRHLMEVSCGLKSQILGEGQIVGQINDAIKLSRQSQCSDSYLETLFRLAVTAGKRALSKARLLNVAPSVSYAAVSWLNEIYADGLRGKRCVVIGNGKMGRLAARLLTDSLAEVYVTLRAHKHGEIIVPHGCKTVAYKDRYEKIDGCDIVISATTSPHYTIRMTDIQNITHKPKIMIDLAMPRDIEPEIERIKEIKLLNIDDFKTDKNFNQKELEKIYKIIEKYMDDYYKWENYKKNIDRGALPHTPQGISSLDP